MYQHIVTIPDCQLGLGLHLQDLYGGDDHILTVDGALARHLPLQVTQQNHMTGQEAQGIADVVKGHVNDHLLLWILPCHCQTDCTILQGGHT